MRSFGKTIDLFLVLIIIRILPDLAGLLSNYLFPYVKSFDPDNTYVWISIHHIIQLIFTIILMKLWFKAPLKELGFNFNDLKLTMKVIGWFCIGFLFLVILNNILPPLVSGEAPIFHYPLNQRNITSVLSFQFLLSGTCEEPLFRGFVMIVLAQSWKGSFHIGRLEIPVSGLWATLFFMFAHISIDIDPLRITHFSIPQQILSFSLGLYYAMLFHKTKSLFGPMLSHGISNVMIYISLYLLAFLMP